MTAAEATLRALLELSRPLATERRGDVLDGALETIARSLGSPLAVAFAVRAELMPAAEYAAPRRQSWRADAVLSQQIPVCAQAACDDHRPVMGSAPDGGYLMASPILHRRRALGALVVMLERRGAGQDLALELFSNVLGLILEAEASHEREAEIRSELVGSGRLASLGVLLTTLAHELQGPVTALTVQREERRNALARLSALGVEHADARALAEELESLGSETDSAIARLGSTLQCILSVGRRDGAHETFDLSDPARDAIELFRPELAQRKIAITQSFDDGAVVRGRRDELGHVVLNLLRNAADACETYSPAPRIHVRTGVDAGRAVLSVEDNGPGVTRSAAQRIFETFYTTKPRGKGTGLGLKICRDVVSGHGGHIEVSSTPAHGATFSVFLPRAASAEIARTTSATGSKAMSQDDRELPDTQPELKRAQLGKLLVIDDDDILSRALKRALRPHEVRLAETAEDASRLLAEPGFMPDLVLCDLNLPGISGDELHRRLRRTQPELASRFVFVTGGALDEQQSRYLRDSGQPTLLKPMSVNDVIALLAKRLEGEPTHKDSISTLRAVDG